jgi:hypothetical protein
MEDLLYELHEKGILDEVLNFASNMRKDDKHKYREYIDVIKEAQSEIEKMKSVDNKC